MKSFFSFLFLTISISMSSFAQVTEELLVMANGQQNAMVLEVADADDNFLSKEWNAFTKDYGRLKRVKKADEYMIEGAQIVDIGGVERINLYSRIEKMGKESSRLITWFNIGSDYVGSENRPEAYAGAVKFLQKFDHHMHVRQVEIELEDEEKEMKKLSSEMDKLQRNNENYHKEIDKCKKKIIEMEADLVKNLEEQELSQKQIEKKEATLDEIKSRLAEIRNRGN